MRVIRVVLRWLALGLVCACGRSESVDLGKPVGTVESVAGVVTAARAAQAPRALALKSEVWADDTVTTAADGSVGIRLGHNGVLWSLEGGQSRRVDTSLAWKAPRGEGGVLDRDRKDRTAAAGRHAEQEAGETGGTAPGVGSPPPPPPADVAQEKEKKEEARGSEDAERDARRRELDAERAREREKRQAAERRAAEEAARAEAARMAAAEQEARAREEMARQEAERRQAQMRREEVSRDQPKGGAPAEIDVTVTVSPLASGEGYRRVVNTRRQALASCLRAEPAVKRAEMTLAVAPDGRIASFAFAGVDDARATCLRGALAGVTFPASEAPVELRLRLTVPPP